MQDSDQGKHSGLFYSLHKRPAVVKVETLLHNLAIVDAKRWSFQWYARMVDIEMQTLGETLVELEAMAPVNAMLQTR